MEPTKATEKRRKAAEQKKIEDSMLDASGIHPALIEAAKLQKRKGEDYGTTDLARSAYMPYGHQSYLHMLHTKLKRVEAVVLAEKGTPVNFESAHDSLLDLINYASFYVAFLKQEEKL